MNDFHEDDCEIPNAFQVAQEVVRDLFERTRSEARADSIAAMNRELPKICKILDLDPVTLEPLESVEA